MHPTPPSLKPPAGPAKAVVHVTLNRPELAALIRAIEREADQARAEGRDGLADRLDWRAADLREAAR